MRAFIQTLHKRFILWKISRNCLPTSWLEYIVNSFKYGGLNSRNFFFSILGLGWNINVPNKLRLISISLLLFNNFAKLLDSPERMGFASAENTNGCVPRRKTPHWQVSKLGVVTTAGVAGVVWVDKLSTLALIKTMTKNSAAFSIMLLRLLVFFRIFIRFL